MPTNKNALTRIKILDEILSDRFHNYTIDDMVERVNQYMSENYCDTNGVSRRTIEKDIRYIEYEMPDKAEIKRTLATDGSKRRFLHYADKTFSLFKEELTPEEVSLLSETFAILGQFDGLPNFGEIERFRSGLNKRGLEQTPKHIISFSKNPVGNSNIIGRLFTAISQKQVIQLHYHTFKEPDVVTDYTLYPYLLKEYNGRWFLFAASTDNNQILNFALDRIVDFEPLPAHKYEPYDGDINDLFEDIIGVTLTEGPVHKIIFWVSDRSCDYVATKPLHASQRNISGSKDDAMRKAYPFLHGGRFFRIDCRENYELIRELTSFGKDLLVLEPHEIQNDVFQHISKVFAKYQEFRK